MLFILRSEVWGLKKYKVYTKEKKKIKEIFILFLNNFFKNHT